MNNIITTTIVFVGQSCVGKSSIVNRSSRDQFSENTVPTIGAGFTTCIKRIGQHNIKFNIWDSAGQERYRTLLPIYYKNASAIVVVYDITSSDSLKIGEDFILQIKKDFENKIMVLVGNKLDLNNQRQVMIENGEALAKKYNMNFLELSAKDCTNIDTLYITIGEKLELENIKEDIENEYNYRCCSIQ